MGCCQWCSKHLRAPARWMVGILEIGICIAIISIIYWHLTEFDVEVESGSITDYACLLGTQDMGRDLCVYGYVLSGVSMVVSLFLMVTVCLKCACWAYVDTWFDWFLTLVGLVWWLVASLVLVKYASDANKENDIQQNWRNIVTILTWIMFFLYACDFIGSQFRLCYKVCGCCGGKQEAYIKMEKEKAREEAESQKQRQAAAVLAASRHVKPHAYMSDKREMDIEAPAVEAPPKRGLKKWFKKDKGKPSAKPVESGDSKLFYK